MSIHRRQSATIFVLTLALTGYATQLGAHAYLDDANPQADAPKVQGGFPKVMLTETQSLSKPASRYAKYDVVGTKAGQLFFVDEIHRANPKVRFHYGFSPRAYQGYNLKDPCNLGHGLTFKRAGPATHNCEVFAGHWLYYAGTRLAAPASATERSLRVADASRLQPGQYVVIYDAPAGSFKNAEHARIDKIDKSTSPHRVTLSVRGYKSKAFSRGNGAIIAQHVTGRAGQHPLNWTFNHAIDAPLDSRRRSIGEAMAAWLQANLGRRADGEPSGVRIDGIYFDADPYYNEIDAARIDGDNDLLADRLISPSGENLWGKGLERFYAMIREQFPELTLVGGARRSRGFDDLNGVQMEGWAVAGDYKAKKPDYGHNGGNDGFDSMLQRYLVHQNYHATANGYMENLSKTPSRLYPNGATGIGSNAAFRFALGSTLLGDGHYGEQNSNRHPDPWYDEYAVDVRRGSSTYGHAVPSKPADESAILRSKGWLGRPLGRHSRIFDSARFAPSKSMLPNGGFENGANGWQFSNLDAKVVSSGALRGSKVLKVDRHQRFTPDVAAAKVAGPRIKLVKGRQYTLAFAARAAEMREITVRVQGSRSIFLVPERWTRIVHTFTATQSGDFRPEFMLGMEDKPVWLDEIYLFDGNANVFMREFQNGIVVVNATSAPRSIDLGQQFRRIKGTQDPVNDGKPLSRLTLPAYDAAILVRP